MACCLDKQSDFFHTAQPNIGIAYQSTLFDFAAISFELWLDKKNTFAT